MAIRVALHHKTEYRYDRWVKLMPQIVRLRPAPHCRTTILGYSIKIEPGGHFINWQQDPYSNHLARLVFPKDVKHFTVEVDLVAELVSINPFDFFIQADAIEFPFEYDARLRKELAPFLERTENGPLLRELVKRFVQPRTRTIDYLVDVNQFLQKQIKYLIRLEPGIQTCEETLTKNSGSCRDTAWLLVQLLRQLGLAARFVSGYLVQLKADEKALDGPSGPEQDFTDLHAWTEVFIPGAGWVGLDPTSGLMASEGHIPLACTADPQDAAPITGSISWDKGDDEATEELETEFRFAMSVTRIHEDPRVTFPYSDEEWKTIDQFGQRIDAELREHDVRLTMGGEPTFVSIDDKDGAEWNTTALGPTKRRLSDQLIRRLKKHFAAGGLLHHGQGKWYPGETLPRWSFNLYWRADGEPIWQDSTLIATEDGQYRYTANHANAFGIELARRLGVNPAHLVPGYEDAWYYLWRERCLPTNVDPLKSNLDNEEERKRLAKVFEHGLGKVVGFALPLKREPANGHARWVSGPWFLRREHLFLIPGDSPMGFRLPLDSLPWVAPGQRDTIVEADPMQRQPALPPYILFQKSLAPGAGNGAGSVSAWQPGPTDDPTVRTALCIEVRQGKMHIFMPPQRTVEDYLDLIEGIEETARSLRIPVQIEGYLPPNDPRLQHLKITPDPGVIEVNVYPAHSWDELVHNTTVLYEEAKQSRLSTDKFQLDGRHTGTCGGNHIVIGGPTPADSPVLRRPDLLASMIAYWHNHPSLSYLFSGLFVGPTSQAPRVDEARNDSVYELELAFKEIPEGKPCPPWIVDRVFRNLLVDVTGNTHRAEFCIDKLYSPDAAGARLGLVEFRAFEMPPHARMSLVQQLLMRAMIARFWKTPYRAGLARWGTELHDRFMLPHFIAQDFHDVIADMRSVGYVFDERWFATHFEFRFPVIGTLSKMGVNLELRTAIEPWHVMGEEPGGGTTVRYVDSSLERMQVKVQGMTDARHILTCNGRRVPLFPTGTNGEFVAGIRYRAWQPPSCLHPTIPVHTPLVVDLYDTWMNRPVSGCTYFVSHPGGRSYDKFPVNANEAEGRRISRFFTQGHTPGPFPVPPELRSPETPLTLDLRYPPEAAPRPDVAVPPNLSSQQLIVSNNNGETLGVTRHGDAVLT